MPLWGLNNTVKKLVRIRKLTTWLAQDRIRFKRNSFGARLLVELLREFPTGKHDDGPDALEMVIRLGDQIWSQMLQGPPRDE